MTGLQIAILEELHREFETFVCRTISEPQLDRSTIDEAVEKFAALVRLTLAKNPDAGGDATAIIAGVATGVEQGFTAMQVRPTPAAANLIARLRVEI